MSNYYKPQIPLVKGDDFIYPLTTADQILLADGSRLNAKVVMAALDDAEDGEDFVPDDNLVINAETLGGKPASSYMLKTDTAINSNKLSGKPPSYYLPVQNLLINPDFAIAQAGYGGKHGDDTYAADSWLGRNAASTVYAALENGGIKIIGGQWACKLQQKLAAKSLRGKKITAGLKLKSSVGRAWATLMALDANRNELANSTKTIACPMETVFAFSIVVPESAEYVVFTFDNNMAETATIEINWTALYEGEYTADTLPPYVPPDPVLELAKCQYYAYIVGRDDYHTHVGTATASTNNIVNIFIPLPNMRNDAAPTVTLEGSMGISSFSGSYALSRVWLDTWNQRGVMIRGEVVNGNFNAAVSFEVYVGAGSRLMFTKDL